MAKKTVSNKAKPAAKNFIVLDEEMQGSCCGERFATKELAIAEAKKHISEQEGTIWDDAYFVAQLVAKVAKPEEVQAVVTEL